MASVVSRSLSRTSFFKVTFSCLYDEPRLCFCTTCSPNHVRPSAGHQDRCCEAVSRAMDCKSAVFPAEHAVPMTSSSNYVIDLACLFAMAYCCSCRPALPCLYLWLMRDMIHYMFLFSSLVLAFLVPLNLIALHDARLHLYQLSWPSCASDNRHYPSTSTLPSHRLMTMSHRRSHSHRSRA